MNAPALDLAPAPAGRKNPTPAGHTLTVRDERFNRDGATPRWWGGDAYSTAWHNALSATFPRGEAMFIEAVKAHRDGADAKLEAEIRAFVKQEINHTREHVVFNKLAENAGYDIKFIDDRVAELMKMIKSRPAIVNLAATMALEHFTAIFAHEFLKNPRHFAGADPEVADMWRWHAVEEIEHKGVAYDTWNHATKDWSPLKRYRLRALMMLIVSMNFLRNRWVDTLHLLKQDGITGWKARWNLAKYLWGTPGVLRRMVPHWASYFKPGFHPWDHDDRELIGKYEGDFSDALLPAE